MEITATTPLASPASSGRSLACALISSTLSAGAGLPSCRRQSARLRRLSRAERSSGPAPGDARRRFRSRQRRGRGSPASAEPGRAPPGRDRRERPDGASPSPRRRADRPSRTADNADARPAARSASARRAAEAMRSGGVPRAPRSARRRRGVRRNLRSWGGAAARDVVATRRSQQHTALSSRLNPYRPPGGIRTRPQLHRARRRPRPGPVSALIVISDGLRTTRCGNPYSPRRR